MKNIAIAQNTTATNAFSFDRLQKRQWFTLHALHSFINEARPHNYLISHFTRYINACQRKNGRVLVSENAVKCRLQRIFGTKSITKISRILPSIIAEYERRKALVKARYDAMRRRLLEALAGSKTKTTPKENQNDPCLLYNEYNNKKRDGIAAQAIADTLFSRIKQQFNKKTLRPLSRYSKFYVNPYT